MRPLVAVCVFAVALAILIGVASERGMRTDLAGHSLVVPSSYGELRFELTVGSHHEPQAGFLSIDRRLVHTAFYHAPSMRMRSSTVSRWIDFMPSPTPVLPYQMGILGALGMVPVSSPRITVLGMGMGATPLAWLQEHPESMVTTVDINSKIVQMSKILIPQLTVFEEVGSLHMRVGDARHTVRSVRDQDILVVDVYGSAAPPPHVTTVEFFKEIKAALVPDGVVVVNTISKTRGPLSDRLYATMATMRAAGFKDLVCFAMRDLNEHGVPRSLDDHDGRPFNVIIMATPHPAVPTSWIFADGTDIGDTAQRIWDGAWQARHHSFWTAQQGVVCSDGGMTADMFDE